MDDTAKIFMTGRSQAVRLPKAYRFASDEVYIRRDPKTGDVILSSKPVRHTTWDAFFAALDQLKPEDVPHDFMLDRNQGFHDRDPFAGYEE
ncbi:MAG TPA: AbrB/MazE/SpoVT family DNA-binding domain-containing protein [Asticcacaulis sp.]|nr:AbrB/MazE/SpoVT family DNA-binding domain-containing protein [Asticcacaulis sp.]